MLRSWGPRKLASLADSRKHVVTLPYSERVAVRWGGTACGAPIRRGDHANSGNIPPTRQLTIEATMHL